MALRMFKNPLLVFLLVLAGSLVPKFHFESRCNLCYYLQVVLYQLTKRACLHNLFTGHARLVGQLMKPSSREVLEMVGHCVIVFSTLIRHALSTNDSALYSYL